MKSANALAPQVAGMKKAMLRRSTWVTSAPWPRSRERKLDSLLGCRRPVRPFDLPPRLEDDDRPLLVLGAAADDRSLNRRAVTDAKTRPWQRNELSSPSTSAARMSRR